MIRIIEKQNRISLPKRWGDWVEIVIVGGFNVPVLARSLSRPKVPKPPSSSSWSRVGTEACLWMDCFWTDLFPEGVPAKYEV